MQNNKKRIQADSEWEFINKLKDLLWQKGIRFHYISGEKGGAYWGEYEEHDENTLTGNEANATINKIDGK